MEHMNDISSVSYTSDAGAILPELQWHEQIVVTKSQVSLTRNGKGTKTKINAGRWAIAADEQKVMALFRQLEAVDCAAIRRIEPDDPPDGGGTEVYTIVYGVNKKFSLLYTPGTTYTGGELLVKPIRTFMQTLNLPTAAASRYR
jgi:hypothetical protein